MFKDLLLFEKPIELTGVLLMTIGMHYLATSSINFILKKLGIQHPNVIVILALYLPFLFLLLFCVNKLLPIF